MYGGIRPEGYLHGADAIHKSRARVEFPDRLRREPYRYGHDMVG